MTGPDDRPKLRMVQLFCRLHHCVMAFVYRPEAFSDAEEAVTTFRLIIDMAIGNCQISPWCPKCGSPDRMFVDTPTAFRTIAELMPTVRKVLEYENHPAPDVNVNTEAVVFMRKPADGPAAIPLTIQ